MSAFALLGAGVMGERYADHICAAGHELSWVYDPDPSKLTHVRSRWGAVPTDRLDDVSAENIIIASPALTHEPMIRFALNRAFRVLCEKPLALSPAAARALKAEAYAGAVLYPALVLLFDDITKSLSANVEGREVTQVRINWDSYRKMPEGPVWDLGPHPLSIIREVWGTNYELHEAWLMPGGVGFRLQYDGMFVEVNLRHVGLSAPIRRTVHFRVSMVGHEDVTGAPVPAWLAADYKKRTCVGKEVTYARGDDPIDRLLVSFLNDEPTAWAMLDEGVVITEQLDEIQDLAWRTGT